MWRDPDEVLSFLEPLSRVLYDALEAATQAAKAFFDDQGSPYEPHLYASLVRYHAQLRLDAGGYDVEFEREELQNCGLLLRHGPFSIRILKSDEGQVPGPGPSKQKQAFYSQLPLPSFDAAYKDDGEVVINLLMLWDTNRLHNLEGLSIALPTGGSTSRRSAKVRWHRPVPHPAAAIIAAIEPELASDADVGDLDLALAGPIATPFLAYTDSVDDLDLALADEAVSVTDAASQERSEVTDDPRRAGQAGS